MGMNVTSDVFQKKLGEIFQNVQGVSGIADDMLSTENANRNMLYIF